MNITEYSSMSVEIHQTRFFKKNFTLKTLSTIFHDKFFVGTKNVTGFTLQLEDAEQNIKTGVVVFNLKNIGYGFELAVRKKVIYLRLAPLATKNDINDFYFFIDQICHLWQIDSFFQNNQPIAIADITKVQQQTERDNIKYIRALLSKKKTETDDEKALMLDATCMVYLPFKLCIELAQLDDQELFNQYATYLNHAQKALLACPPNYGIVQLQNLTFGLLTIYENQMSIVPLNKQLLIPQLVYREHPDWIDFPWLVCFITATQVSLFVPYAEFLNLLTNEQVCGEVDFGRFLLNSFTEEQFRQVFNSSIIDKEALEAYFDQLKINAN